MQNNIISKVFPSTRLICLFVLSISLFLAKSVFLILFITTLTLILILITEKSVKSYVNYIKKRYILLLFFLIIYIMIFKYDVFNLIFFSYKLIIFILLFAVLRFNISFNQLHQAIYTCLIPLEKVKINVQQFSFDIVKTILFIKRLINNSHNFFKLQKIYGRKKQGIKNNITSILLKTKNELNEFQCCLKIKKYKLKKENENTFSKIILIFVIILFLIVIFKEVIL